MATRNYVAHHYYADVTARKLRPFANLIRGKQADEAIEALKYLPNRGARLIEAVLKSALGNAEFKDERDMEELYVSEARVDGGPMFKRIQTRARGMAYGILKRLAHIHVTVSSPDNGEAN
ncbi:MAG: 50S ribosomal protein L22 [Gemmatales bacterium]